MAVQGETLLAIKDAQLHEVNNGQQQLKEWGSLQVVTHAGEAGAGLWIQIGKTEWAVDTAMPTLEAAPRTYTFALEKGRFFSVLLSAETPEEEVLTFREILHECTAFEVAGASKLDAKTQSELVDQVAQEVAEDDDVVNLKPNLAPGASPTTSQRILQGAAVVQEKLLSSANWASRKIIEQSDNYLAQHEATQDPVKVSPNVIRTVKLARRAAETGSRVATRVASGIADITIKISDALIRHLGPSKTGEELNDPNKRPNAAKEVAAAALLAATGIYDSMEQASHTVLDAGGQASSTYIGHKYGPDAGVVAQDATSAAVTGGLAYMRMEKVGLRKIARRVAKRTATGLMKAHLGGSGQAASNNQEQQQNGAQQGANPAGLASSQAQAAPPNVQPTQFGQYGPPSAATQVPAQGAELQPGQYGAPPGRIPKA